MVARPTTPPRPDCPITRTVALPAELAELIERKAKIERCSPDAVIRFCIDQQLGGHTSKEADHATDRQNAPRK